jgi:hypothetical protein
MKTAFQTGRSNVIPKVFNNTCFNPNTNYRAHTHAYTNHLFKRVQFQTPKLWAYVSLARLHNENSFQNRKEQCYSKTVQQYHIPASFTIETTEAYTGTNTVSSKGAQLQTPKL